MDDPEIVYANLGVGEAGFQGFTLTNAAQTHQKLWENPQQLCEPLTVREVGRMQRTVMSMSLAQESTERITQTLAAMLDEQLTGA